jgi:hypothetical protein
VFVQRREFLVGVAALSSGTGGCGWILHPERCGQLHSHDIDWKIAALDGLGLLLFFVPGVVAFVVDFYTGAIYLPLESCPQLPHSPAPSYGYPPPSDAPQQYYPALPAPPQASLGLPPAHGVAYATDLNRVAVPREELSPQRIEEVVTGHVGRPISLTSEDVRLSHLRQLDRYADQCRRHEQDSRFGFGIKRLLDRWQNA